MASTAVCRTGVRSGVGAVRRPACAHQRVLPVGARSPALSKMRGRKLVVRAEQTTTEFDVDKLLKDAAEKWDKVENKSAVVVYGFSAITLIWFANTIISALGNVPLLPKFMELVGLGYTAWFTYRYLLFKSSREELVKDIDELKKKISGTQ